MSVRVVREVPRRAVGEFSVAIANDTLWESTEYFTITLSNPAGANLGLAGRAVAITDDDPAPTVSFRQVVPDAPTNLTASLTLTGEVRLAWEGTDPDLFYGDGDGDGDGGRGASGWTSGVGSGWLQVLSSSMLRACHRWPSGERTISSTSLPPRSMGRPSSSLPKPSANQPPPRAFGNSCQLAPSSSLRSTY